MVAKRKGTRQDTRLHRKESSVRAGRAAKDRRATQDRALSDEERIDEFRMAHFQSALPDLPKIRGYHMCWLTTTNPRDPIHTRLRMGYQLVRAEEIPGWDHSSIKSGEYDGFIGVNEMIAAKLPLKLYEAYMKEAHYTRPLQEEENLTRARAKAEEEASQYTKRRISFSDDEMEGQAEIGRNVPPPPESFEKTLA